MKKLYFLFSFFAACTVVSAQQMPNGDFESWTNVDALQLDPTGYFTPDSAEFQFSSVEAVVQTTDKHGGQFAVKLITDMATLPPSVGRLVLGTSTEKGVPFTGKPLQLRGWTKGELANEPGSLSIGLKSGGILIAEASATFSGDYDWTEFTADIMYYDTLLTPDSLTFLASLAGNADGALYIDDLEFVYGGVGVETSVVTKATALYPNPTAGNARLVVSNVPTTATFTITDALGRTVQHGLLTNGVADISLARAGHFTVNVYTETGALLGRERLLVQ